MWPEAREAEGGEVPSAGLAPQQDVHAIPNTTYQTDSLPHDTLTLACTACDHTRPVLGTVCQAWGE